MSDEECKCPPPGLPAWMGTFADLMSLLMCFFVLLLAFSEMDVLKFKQIAGSMKFAFGVLANLVYSGLLVYLVYVSIDLWIGLVGASMHWCIGLLV